MAIGVAVNTRERLIMEVRMDIIDHLYIMVLDLCELEKTNRKKKRRSRVVNTYDNNLRAV